MSKHLREHWHLLHFLMHEVQPKQLKAVLSTLDRGQTDVLGEIAVNVLYGTIPISEEHKGKLKPYASKVEYIGDSRNSLKSRRDLILANPRMIVLLMRAVKPLLKSLLQ